MRNIYALNAANADADKFGIGWIMVLPGHVFERVPPELVSVQLQSRPGPGQDNPVPKPPCPAT